MINELYKKETRTDSTIGKKQHVIVDISWLFVSLIVLVIIIFENVYMTND